MAKEGELWHLVEAKREDDSPTIFRIRELEPRLDQPRIFVAELPYPIADGSKLPDAPAYRRFATFEEQWLDPACSALGWTPVGVKIEDGSFFVYLYGTGEPRELIERLSPFDGALGFFDEIDPTWDEYRALRELLDEARTLPPREPEPEPDAPIPQVDTIELIVATEHTKTTTLPARPRARANKAKRAAKARSAPKPKAARSAKAKPAAKTKPARAAKAKPAAKRAPAKAKPAAKAKPTKRARAKR